MTSPSPPPGPSTTRPGPTGPAPTRPASARPTPARTGSFTGRAVIVGLALGLLVLGLAMPVRAWFAQRAEIAALQAEVDATEARVAELTVLKERWTDPAFIAAEARRRLHFVLPGEVGYVALDAEGRPAAESLSAAAQENLPWFEALWGSVAAADAAPEDVSRQGAASTGPASTDPAPKAEAPTGSTPEGAPAP